MFSIKRVVLTLVLILGVVLAGCTPAATPTEVEAPAAEPAEVEAPAAEVEEPAVEAEEPAAEAEAPPATEPTTLIVAFSSAPTTVDPADHRDRNTESLIRNMFDGLVTRDATSGVHNELAESFNWADDTTLEVTLRQGVLFHNGVEMTADDVVYTFERVIKENMIEYPEAHTSPRKGLIAQLESIEKTGDYAVTMHFSAPYPTAMQMLVHQQVIPMGYMQEVGTQGLLDAPIGAGPFKFISAQPGYTEVVMEKFADYYGGAPDLEPVGPACVDTVVFRVIPEASTRVAALLAGEVDIIQNVPAELVSTLEQVPGIQIKTAVGTSPQWMEMNVNQAPFDDVKVRQAMNYAVDKQLLVDAIFGGKAEVLSGPLSPYNAFVNKSLQPYAYDPDKALALLAEAGWTDSDGDTFLDKGGTKFSFIIDTEEDFRAISEAVAGQLQAIGIEASVRIWEYSVIKPLLQAGERQAFLNNWGDSAFDPVGHMEAKWHGYVEGTTYGRGNFSGYNNERVNELIKLGEVTVDIAERQTIYDEAQQIIYDEVPAIFLVLPDVVSAAAADVQNWEPAADGRFNMHDVCIGQ
ncbi:MAG: ABC transporter substrate-binding protein [Anaerolineales bacterium]|nr:ABC transporter substrate-binding protein [Anaerolineales bacterium]